LVEPYRLPPFDVQHVDLYRLRDPAELDELALWDNWGSGAILLAEWPERGGDRLPPADADIELSLVGQQRRAVLSACSAAGQQLLGVMPDKG
jgi:tRNA threonylcarbamoyladenosine biosynthesis protein TsaE